MIINRRITYALCLWVSGETVVGNHRRDNRASGKCWGSLEIRGSEDVEWCRDATDTRCACVWPHRWGICDIVR